MSEDPPEPAGEPLTDEQFDALGRKLLRDTEIATRLNESITADWRRYGAERHRRRLRLVKDDDDA